MWNLWRSMNLNRDQLSEVIAKNERLVREVAYRLGFDLDDDAMQAGRIGLWEAARTWDGGRPFEPFARRCIRNNMIDYSRKRSPQEDELKDDVASEEPEEAESREELIARIRSVFPRRSREWKILYSLINGKSKSFIAQKLHVSERTVDRIAKRAAARLEQEKQGQ